MRPNNLDLTRLILASMVFLGHVCFLSQQKSLQFIQSCLGGFSAVEGFFCLSGFLIFASYERSESLRIYFVKRASRILPAYWLSTVICVGIAFYFSRALHVGKFLIANLTFLNFIALTIPGVFAGNPKNAVMNGSLWTIKIEIGFYIVVPLVVWISRKLGGINRALMAIGVLSVLYRFVVAPYSNTLSYQLPGQMYFFCVGALTYYNIETFKRIGLWILPAALVAYFGFLKTHWFVFDAISVPVIVLSFGLLLPEMKGPTRWGDFSYGTYVLHYPILQTMIALGMFNRSPFGAFLLSAVIVSAAATASWFLVERPCLSYAHRLAEYLKTDRRGVPENELQMVT